MFRAFFLSFILAALAKEDVGIFIGSFGLYILLTKRDLKGVPLLLGYIWSVGLMAFLMPKIRGGVSDTLERYKDWGGPGAIDIAKNIISQPVKALQYSFQELKIILLIKIILATWIFIIFFTCCISHLSSKFICEFAWRIISSV